MEIIKSRNHSHYWLSGMAGIILADRSGMPLVHTMHTMARVKNANRGGDHLIEPDVREDGEAEIVRRPRFSTLRYAGAQKLSRLPLRSAIVAFSGEQVYALAEMLRVLRPDGSLLLADHVAATNPVLRVVQGLLDVVTVPWHGEHFSRRPRVTAEAFGVRVIAADRLHHGVIERLHARPR